MISKDNNGRMSVDNLVAYKRASSFSNIPRLSNIVAPQRKRESENIIPRESVLESSQQKTSRINTAKKSKCASNANLGQTPLSKNPSPFNPSSSVHQPSSNPFNPNSTILNMGADQRTKSGELLVNQNMLNFQGSLANIQDLHIQSAACSANSTAVKTTRQSYSIVSQSAGRQQPKKIPSSSGSQKNHQQVRVKQQEMNSHYIHSNYIQQKMQNTSNILSNTSQTYNNISHSYNNISHNCNTNNNTSSNNIILNNTNHCNFYQDQANNYHHNNNINNRIYNNNNINNNGTNGQTPNSNCLDSSGKVMNNQSNYNISSEIGIESIRSEHDDESEQLSTTLKKNSSSFQNHCNSNSSSNISKISITCINPTIPFVQKPKQSQYHKQSHNDSVRDQQQRYQQQSQSSQDQQIETNVSIIQNHSLSLSNQSKLFSNNITILPQSITSAKAPQCNSYQRSATMPSEDSNSDRQLFNQLEFYRKREREHLERIQKLENEKRESVNNLQQNDMMFYQLQQQLSQQSSQDKFNQPYQDSNSIYQNTQQMMEDDKQNEFVVYDLFVNQNQRDQSDEQLLAINEDKVKQLQITSTFLEQKLQQLECSMKSKQIQREQSTDKSNIKGSSRESSRDKAKQNYNCSLNSNNNNNNNNNNIQQVLVQAYKSLEAKYNQLQLHTQQQKAQIQYLKKEIQIIQEQQPSFIHSSVMKALSLCQ